MSLRLALLGILSPALLRRIKRLILASILRRATNGCGRNWHEHVQGRRHRQERSRSERRDPRVRRGGSHGRRRDRARVAFDAELQGRPCPHRQGAGGAPLSDDPRRRSRRHRRGVLEPGFQARRRGRPQRLGLGRNPSRRLCGEGAGERRLADPAAAGPFRATGHGHRHGGLHGDAVPDGFGAAWASSGSRSRHRHRRRRRRRLGGRGAARQGRLACDRLDRAAGGGGLSERSRRRRDPRPQRARRARRGRSPRSAGRRASTPSARPRSPMFCR